MDFSEWLRARMAEAGIASQMELSALLKQRGMSYSTSSISNWVRGEKVPRPGTLIAIMDVFGVAAGAPRAAIFHLAYGKDAA